MSTRPAAAQTAPRQRVAVYLAERSATRGDVTERLSPHGLRAAFITEAYLHGVLDEQAGAHARQKNLNTTRLSPPRKDDRGQPAKLLDL